MSKAHQIKDPADQKAFLLAGRAIFTILNTKTGNRLTFRVSRKKKAKKNPQPGELKTEFVGPHFVGVLAGPDNEDSYCFLGTIFEDGTFKLSGKSSYNSTDAAYQGFDWYWANLKAGATFPEALQFWHEGRCGRCGRQLTVPESVERGIGPECSGKGYTQKTQSIAKKKAAEVALTAKEADKGDEFIENLSKSIATMSKKDEQLSAVRTKIAVTDDILEQLKVLGIEFEYVDAVEAEVG